MYVKSYGLSVGGMVETAISVGGIPCHPFVGKIQRAVGVREARRVAEMDVLHLLPASLGHLGIS